MEWIPFGRAVKFCEHAGCQSPTGHRWLHGRSIRAATPPSPLFLSFLPKRVGALRTLLAHLCTEGRKICLERFFVRLPRECLIQLAPEPTRDVEEHVGHRAGVVKGVHR